MHNAGRPGALALRQRHPERALLSSKTIAITIARPASGQNAPPGTYVLMCRRTDLAAQGPHFAAQIEVT
jgi:hypothetical protein